MHAVIVAVIALLVAAPVRAAWSPTNVDLTRPRLLLRANDVPIVQARIASNPYRRVAVQMMNRAQQADGIALDDHAIGSERIKARAAKNLSFLYAIDRTVADGQVVPFPTPDDRAAVGARVRDLLVNMYARSRLAVPPPLGGWDRDISTSEELIGYATAYDTLAGAGYDLGSDAAVIEQRIADLASEVYDNYVHPETASNFALLHQNNHRSKTGAALVMAGIALADYTPEPGTNPRGIREPSVWIDYGLGLVDLILRYALVTGDGVYAEGPFYLRYTAQNILPLARAWDRLIGRDWQAGPLTIPNLWRHPLFLRSQRWLLDVTLPDGSLAPFDDGNPGRAYYFGAAPFTADTQAAFAWRWANAPATYETDGNVDLAADSIINFDASVAAAPPATADAAFYLDGGNAVFRSDWSTDAVHAVILGEHDTASEFGRDRDGRGLSPESHEHAEPGSFMLNAFGETLALDPGYLDFGARTMVNQPQHHNLILVDGRGPVDYLAASIAWAQQDLFGRPPADGQATLSDALDSGFIQAVRVTSRYGQPAARAALIDRRFLFADNRYLLIADDVRGPGSPAATFTWLLHGNGGGDSGGTFEERAAGGRWSRPAARLDSVSAFDSGPAIQDTDTAVHEAAGRQQRTHTVLETRVSGRHIRSAQLIYPSDSDDEAPEATALQLVQGTAVLLVDNDGDRRVLAWHREGRGGVSAPAPFAAIDTDGQVGLFDVHLDGRLRLAWAEEARTLGYGELRLMATVPGTLGMRANESSFEAVAVGSFESVSVAGLPFSPVAVDGACGFAVDGARVVVQLSRERRFGLRADAGNAQPAADPGDEQRVAIGTTVTLDGRASCDADGDALSAKWEMISAPAGSDWTLRDSETLTPSFDASHRGPYRIRLVVTDARGLASRSSEVLVLAGERCTDTVDDDRDGLFDSDDADCDATTSLPPSGCTGDCDDVGAVTVANLVRCVGIALGADLVRCTACDGDGNGNVAVNELVASVNNLLRGCR